MKFSTSFFREIILRLSQVWDCWENMLTKGVIIKSQIQKQLIFCLLIDIWFQQDKWGRRETLIALWCHLISIKSFPLTELWKLQLRFHTCHFIAIYRESPNLSNYLSVSWFFVYFLLVSTEALFFFCLHLKGWVCRPHAIVSFNIVHFF